MLFSFRSTRCGRTLAGTSANATHQAIHFLMVSSVRKSMSTKITRTPGTDRKGTSIHKIASEGSRKERKWRREIHSFKRARFQEIPTLENRGWGTRLSAGRASLVRFYLF